MVQRYHIAFSSNLLVHLSLGLMLPVCVHREINGDPSHPEENTLLVIFELCDAFHGACKGLSEDILGEFNDG